MPRLYSSLTRLELLVAEPPRRFGRLRRLRELETTALPAFMAMLEGHAARLQALTHLELSSFAVTEDDVEVPRLSGLRSLAVSLSDDQYCDEIPACCAGGWAGEDREESRLLLSAVCAAEASVRRATASCCAQSPAVSSDRSVDPACPAWATGLTRLRLSCNAYGDQPEGLDRLTALQSFEVRLTSCIIAQQAATG